MMRLRVKTRKMGGEEKEIVTFTVLIYQSQKITETNNKLPTELTVLNQ